MPSCMNIDQNICHNQHFMNTEEKKNYYKPPHMNLEQNIFHKQPHMGIEQNIYHNPPRMNTEQNMLVYVKLYRNGLKYRNGHLLLIK